ncbi:MAG: hypothetical protein BZ135_03285 [Methanosphaera sp. rholeuAM6]|nr:MAG: hypothetical protein BZ135_03285 [Methanosphaera sp. rholeuAM6]
MMVLNIKKIAVSGLGKKIGILFTLQNIKLAMIVFDKLTRKLDYLEEKGHIGSWNSGRKFTIIKKVNSKIISMI